MSKALFWMLWVSGQLVSESRFDEHVARLASDAMEGRAPGTEGGDRAARYIFEQLREAGLAPELHEVPLVARAAPEEASLKVLAGRQARVVPAEAFRLSSETANEMVELKAPVVFEKIEDAAGAIIALRLGDRHEDIVLARARELGARGVVLIVDEPPSRPDEPRWAPDWEAARGLEVVARVEASRGVLDPAEDVELEIRLRSRVRRFSSPNVVATLAGKDPNAGAVLLIAYYDAYGIGEPDASGDPIYNGALDNAMGVSALIELAAHFAASDAPLDRTLVFVATTAEEHGALGARFYADHPLVPLGDIAIVLNIDGINPVAPTDDFIVFPSQGIEVSEALSVIGKRVAMHLVSESWQEGMHFAFDTAPFLVRGLVGITLWQGPSYRGLSRNEATKRRKRFGNIHTPGDEWPGSSDRDAVAQHLRLYIAAVEHFVDGSTPRSRVSTSGPFAP